jgi:hypothetical protein
MEAAAIPEQFNLTALIDKHLQRDNVADPLVIATRIAEEIPSHHLRPVVAQLLGNAVRLREGEKRRKRLPNTSQKWNDVQRDQESGALDLWRWRIHVPNLGWAFFGDLSLEDVLAVANGYDVRARELQDEGDKFRRVADLMERERAATVRRLNHDTVKEIFA